MLINASNEAKLEVVYRVLSDLKPHANNARTHSKAQAWKIANSIRAFNFTNPVLIDGEGTIIAGHGRVEAAKLLKLERVPTIRIDTLSQDQIRAYIHADSGRSFADIEAEVLAHA